MRVLRGILFILTIALAADPITPGTYTGKWQGNSGASGDFRIALTTDGTQWKADVSFTMTDTQVKCVVTALAVEGAKLHVVYTFELLGMNLESTIVGERNGARLSGQYKTRAVADSTAVDEGTWEASTP